MMKRPSRDQSFASFGAGDSSNKSSLPAPLDDFRYRLRGPLRAELNTMRAPSGDHTGPKSTAGSKVNRVVICRAGSSTQTSEFPFTLRSSATRLPSGDSSGFKGENPSGGAASPSRLPDRSNHTSCRLLEELPVRYASRAVPAEIAAMLDGASKAACSATENGSPI